MAMVSFLRISSVCKIPHNLKTEIVYCIVCYFIIANTKKIVNYSFDQHGFKCPLFSASSLQRNWKLKQCVIQQEDWHAATMVHPRSTLVPVPHRPRSVKTDIPKSPASDSPQDNWFSAWFVANCGSYLRVPKDNTILTSCKLD